MEEIIQLKDYLKIVSLEGEEWKYFKASERSKDEYIIWHISNKGRVAKNKIISYGKQHKDGYCYLGNMKAIHRLVAELFIPKSEEDILNNRNHIDHIDGDRANNNVNNLRWCTIKENNNFELARKHKSQCRIGVLNHNYNVPPANKYKQLYNNGKESHYFSENEVPEGFFKGRLHK